MAFHLVRVFFKYLVFFYLNFCTDMKQRAQKDLRRAGQSQLDIQEAGARMPVKQYIIEQRKNKIYDDGENTKTRVCVQHTKRD